MSGRAFRDVTSTAGANLGTALLTSVGGVFLARQLGSADRGHLVTVLQWPALFGSLASFGLTQATCYRVSQRPHEGDAVVRTAVRAALVTGLLVAVAGIPVASLLADTRTVEKLLRLVFVVSPLFIAGGVWMSSLQATDIREWNRSRIVQPVFYFAGICLMALSGRLTLTAAAVVFCLSLMAQATVARHGSRMAVEHSGSSGPHLRALYRYGVRVWVSSIPQLVNVRLDLLILSVLPSIAAADLGTYAVAASLSWLALPAAMAFGSVAFPTIAAAPDEPARRRIERRSLLGAAISAGAVLVLICLLAPLVVPRLFGADFSGAVGCLWLLAPGTACLAANRVIDNLLQGRGYPMWTSAGEGIGAVLTVCLLATLAPRFGIRGAAAASSVAYFGTMVGLYIVLRRARQRATLEVVGEL